MAAAQALLEELQADFDPEQGDITMFPLDLPDMPYEHAPIIFAQAALKQAAGVKADRTIGVCHLATNIPGDQRFAYNIISPAESVGRYFRQIGRPEIAEAVATSIVSVLQSPTIGELSDLGAIIKRHGDLVDTGIRTYSYLAKPDYEGTDKATFLVEIAGLKVKVVYRFVVAHTLWGGADGYDPFEDRKYCPKGEIWKISLPATMLDSAFLQPLLNFTGIANTVNVEVVDLHGSAIGSTSNTSITLDTNAAGYNWFIDATPADNAEFLPTSNPNEWVAKAGSDAAGKMDMLSVLIHEYGHALGIEHSADSNDYMAATLQPGVRRLPSHDELALMAQLVGEAVGRVSTRQVGMNSDLPGTPINPSLPIGAGMSALLIGRLRRTDYGSWSPLFDSAQIPAPAP